MGWKFSAPVLSPMPGSPTRRCCVASTDVMRLVKQLLKGEWDWVVIHNHINPIVVFQVLGPPQDVLVRLLLQLHLLVVLDMGHGSELRKESTHKHPGILDTLSYPEQLAQQTL